MGRPFHLSCTFEGTWQSLKRLEWPWQQPTRRAIERAKGAVEVGRKETWPRVRTANKMR
nr:winged helix-turn-helix domain-containing protein [Kitasatospora phosalacinea]